MAQDSAGDGLSFTLHEIAAAIGGAVWGDGALVAARLRHPAEADRPGDLAMAMGAALVKQLAGARLAVIDSKTDPEALGLAGAVIAPAGRAALHGAASMFHAFESPPPGAHPSAVIEDGAHVDPSASIGPFCRVRAGAVIGANCVLHEGVSVGLNARVGPNGRFGPGARIGRGATLGAHAIVHANAVIGADGFSFLAPQMGEAPGFTEQGYPRIPSLGAVTVGDHVEIGANTAIDNGSLRDTIIGDGVKIDNLVQIAHNVSIGDNCLICGQVGLAGSAEIGPRCILGGQVGVANHAKIGSDCMVGAGSGVASNVRSGSVVMGYPAWPQKEMQRVIMEFRRLPKLADRLNALEKAFLQLDQ